jgi:hypothetical protein
MHAGNSTSNPPMARLYFTYTAILEALTGLGLIIMPAIVTRILLGGEARSALEIVLAMVGGAAICSVALASWLSRISTLATPALWVLLFYNLAVSFILLYASLKFGYNGIPLYGVIIVHIIQSVFCVALLKKQSRVISKH